MGFFCFSDIQSYSNTQIYPTSTSALCRVLLITFLERFTFALRFLSHTLKEYKRMKSSGSSNQLMKACRLSQFNAIVARSFDEVTLTPTLSYISQPTHTLTHIRLMLRAKRRCLYHIPITSAESYFYRRCLTQTGMSRQFFFSSSSPFTLSGLHSVGTMPTICTYIWCIVWCAVSIRSLLCRICIDVESTR